MYVFMQYTIHHVLASTTFLLLAYISLQTFLPITTMTESCSSSSTAVVAVVAKAIKETPKNLIIPPKKPKLTKAERRALQESQRADKASTLIGDAKKPALSVKDPSTNTTSPAMVADATVKASTTATTTANNSNNNNNKKTDTTKAIASLAHLPPYRGTYDWYSFDSDCVLL
jgi:hypothetical protein